MTGVGQGCVSSRRVARFEDLVRLEGLVGGAAAIRAAASVDLLELLAVGAASAEQAAEALGLDERPTRRLLEVLVTLGVASADPHERYRLTLEARTLVDSRLGLWDALPDVLRRGPSPRPRRPARGR